MIANPLPAAVTGAVRRAHQPGEMIAAGAPATAGAPYAIAPSLP